MSERGCRLLVYRYIAILHASLGSTTVCDEQSQVGKLDRPLHHCARRWRPLVLHQPWTKISVFRLPSRLEAQLERENE
jgi:hypothetical protein